MKKNIKLSTSDRKMLRDAKRKELAATEVVDEARALDANCVTTPAVENADEDSASAVMVSNNLRITTDALNWIVESRSIVGESKTGKGRAPDPKNVGKVRWVTEGYYGTCEQALRACIDERLRAKLSEAGIVDVRGFLDALNEVKSEIREALAQATVLAAKLVQRKEDGT